jgi:hypothetical protein
MIRRLSKVASRSLPVSPFLMVCLLVTQCFEFAAANHIRVTPKRQLFVDFYLIERMEGVHRTLHQPKRFQGNPVLRADRLWERSVMINGAPSVIYDPKTKTFKMWYFTYTAVDEKTRKFGESYFPSFATSTDGVHWEKPNLGLVEYAGTRQNNLLPWESQIMNGCSNVLYDVHDPDPQRRYKSLYHSYRRVNDTRQEAGLYISFSPDGIHWKDYAGNPVLDGAFNSPTAKVHDTHTILGWNERLGKYVAFLRPSLALGGGIRVIGLSTSSDFIRWKEPGRQIVVRPDNQDSKGTEFYGMPVILYEDVYVGLIWVYHNDPYWPWPNGVTIPEEKLERHQQTMDTQLATSRDALHWERSANRKAFMPVGPLESWDDGCIYPTTPLVVGDGIWIYYGGMNMRHTKESLSTTGRMIRGKRREAAVGLAKIRLDGFVSIDSNGRRLRENHIP